MSLTEEREPAAAGAHSPSWPAGARTLKYGGDYNPEQWPRETWVEDIRLMRDAGVNLVSIGIFSWALIEPREGEFDFTYLDDIMTMLADAGIDVDLGTPTAAPPAWFWARHPEAHPVLRDGTVLGAGSRGMASPSSPAYRRAVASVTGRLAARYAGHPALRMWHVHNEYGAPVSESYDEASVAAFRLWLERRYGTLERLNTAWGTTFWGQRYGRWDEIDAPRVSATVVNQAQRLDFARFSSDAMLECFVIERDIIRSFTPGLPVTTNFMATNCPSVDYWKWSREVDVVANDHYLAAERLDNHVLLAMDADLTRSLAGGQPWMLMEHSTSAVNWQPRNIAKRRGELARNSLSHLARGADAIMFFQFRASRYGAEKFHSAMLPHDGTSSRIWSEVLDLGETMRAVEELRGSVVRARVAILWDVESFWAQALEWRPSVELDARERIVAFYTALFHRGVTVDFAHPSADLSGYHLVVAAASYLVDDAAKLNLEQYVAEGGNLLASYFSGIVDQSDTVPLGGYPGRLRDVLGVVVSEWLPLREGETVRLENGDASSWTEDVVLHGARAVERYENGPAAGGAAITVNGFGAGRAWYVSTRPDAATLDRLLGDVLDAAGVESPAHAPGLEVVTRHAGDAAFTIAINHADIDSPVPVPGIDLVTGESVAVNDMVPAGRVRIIRLGE